MREIRLRDTRTGRLVPLAPRDPGRVGIYVCGPTVYSRIHVGNARPFVIFSLLKRFLEHEGLQVTLVINVTDVNDKIYVAARAREVPSSELAAEMTRAYMRDTDALGLDRPDSEPLASESMEAIVAYIQTLIDDDHAYTAEGDVFFRVRSDPDYGTLSHRQVDDMDQGEGIEGSERKQDPLDFALWKASKPDEDTCWPAPWGEGRPGWHIECSAMAESALGVGFDIHGGGSDLIFPHHENEASQTRAARGTELARIWSHNGMIQMTGEKMAKSAGNIAPLHELLGADGPGRDAVLMYLVSGHYRQPLAFSSSELQDAEKAIYRLRDCLGRLGPAVASPPEMAHHKETFLEALADDFNTPRALASVFNWVREANGRREATGDADLREMLGLLGLDGLEPLRRHGDTPGIDAEAASLLEQRERARADRDFALADALREQIRELGWEVRDGPTGAELIGASVIVYGRNPVMEALRGRRRHAISRVWATPGAARESWLAEVPLVNASAQELESLCGSAAHQGICAEAGGYHYVSAGELLAREQPLIVALDQVQDPQNLGSICRTAECVGADGLVIPERRSAEVTAAVCKASAGAVEHLPVARLRNLADFLVEAKQAGCWCYGASLDRGSVDYGTPDYGGSGIVLVLGSEGAGLRPRVAAACDQLIRLPLRGRIDSLGVAAAAAAILYAIAARRASSD